MKEPPCIEYIIIHELVQLLERKRDDRFKAYMDNFLPNWKGTRDELNGIGYEGRQGPY